MLLTESKLRKIIAEEYAKLQKEGMYPRGGEDERGTHGRVSRATQKEYDVIFAAIKKIEPQLRSASSTEEVAQILKTAEGGNFWNNRKWLGALQASSTVRHDDNLSNLMSPILAKHLPTLSF